MNAQSRSCHSTVGLSMKGFKMMIFYLPDVDDDNGVVRNHPLRLHRLRINHQEDGSLMVP